MGEPAISLRPQPSQTVMAALMELYHDSPSQFEQLARWAARAGRPAYGSITITFQESKIVLVRKEETKR